MKFPWVWFVAWVRNWMTLPAQLCEAEKRLDLQRKLNANLVNARDARARERVAMESELALLREGRDTPLTPGLTAAEIERLAMLAEECGEVAQAVGKVLRHGYQSASPYPKPHGGMLNRVSLERELGDVRAVIDMMVDAGDVRGGDVRHWARTKRANVGKWTHHQGALTEY